MSVEQVLDAILGNLGTLVTLIIILYGGYKRWWVFGWYAQELKASNTRLENRLDDMAREARTVTSIAEKTTTALTEKSTEVPGV